jgi:DNA polymerase (family 10)
MAVQAGVKLAIDTDAHSRAALDYMRFGVMNARRGWATADDVVNTRRWPELKQLLKQA